MEKALVKENQKNGHMLIEGSRKRESTEEAHARQKGRMLIKGSRNGESIERLKKMMMNRVFDQNIIRQRLVTCRMQKPSR